MTIMLIVAGLSAMGLAGWILISAAITHAGEDVWIWENRNKDSMND